MSEILLIDLSAIYARFWHSPDNEETADGAQRRTVAKIRGLARAYDHVAICVDDWRSFRHDLHSAYKAQRAAKPPDFKVQLNNTIHQLTLDGFPIWKHANCEADDVIASATTEALRLGHKVTIATGDKDLLQLVGPGVCVLSTATDAIIGPDETRAKYGVDPLQMGDYLALVGDASDNVPGVKGVGAKTAAEWLGDHRSILGILDWARQMEAEIREATETNPKTPQMPKVWASLLASQETLALARKLVDLKNDLPIDIGEALRPRVSAPLTKADTYEEEDKNMSDESENTNTIPAAPDSEERTARPHLEAVPEPASVEMVVSKPDAYDAQPRQPTTLARVVDWEQTLEPQSLPAALTTAKHLHNSRLFSHFNNAEGIFAAILLARSHGLEAMKVLMPGMIHSIKGKLTMSAQMMIGLILRSGKAEYFDLVESTDKVATYVTKRKGAKHEVPMSFTIEEAKAAGYLQKGGPWDTRPKVMLRHRCETELGRAVYPDVVGGLYSVDEMSDGEAA